jgi:hypothetical protein
VELSEQDPGDRLSFSLSRANLSVVVPAAFSGGGSSFFTVARELGGLSLYDALVLCELMANANPARYDRRPRAGLSGSLPSGCRR